MTASDVDANNDRGLIPGNARGSWYRSEIAEDTSHNLLVTVDAGRDNCRVPEIFDSFANLGE